MQHFEQLDIYTAGDPDFKLKLMKLIIENLQELQLSLSEAIQHNDPAIFSKACHKAKTTVAMLDINELSSVAAEPEKTMQAQDKANVFFKLCDNLIRNLGDEIAKGNNER